MSRRATMAGLLVMLMVLGAAAQHPAAPAPTAPQDDANDACPSGLVRVKAANHPADRNRNGYVCQAAPAATPGAKATPGAQAKPTASPGAKPGTGGAPAKGQIEVIVVDDQAGKCPPGFTLVRNVPTHPADANKNGIVCGKVKGSDE